MLAKDLLSLFSYQYQKLLSMIDLQIIYSFAFVFLESYPRGHAEMNVNDKTAKKKNKKKKRIGFNLLKRAF